MDMLSFLAWDSPHSSFLLDDDFDSQWGFLFPSNASFLVDFEYSYSLAQPVASTPLLTLLLIKGLSLVLIRSRGPLFPLYS